MARMQKCEGCGEIMEWGHGNFFPWCQFMFDEFRVAWDLRRLGADLQNGHPSQMAIDCYVGRVEEWFAAFESTLERVNDDRVVRSQETLEKWRRAKAEEAALTRKEKVDRSYRRRMAAKERLQRAEMFRLDVDSLERDGVELLR